MYTTETATLTIGKLASQAGVGIETVRYYQQRGLLPVPSSRGSYRQYPVTMIERIRFIKRAQELGFALDEIGELLALDDHNDKTTIRQIASDKIEQIQKKLDDLQRMQSTLQTLVSCCASSTMEQRCPIIDSLSETSQNN
jgi:MerR family mercuric resistance operon transcriptional regulator